MIIAAVIIAALLLFICMTAIKTAALRNTLSILCAIAVVLSMVLMVRNDREHFGMHRVSRTQNYSLVSSAGSTPSMLLYKSIGTAGKEKAYLYKTSNQPKKLQHTNPDPEKSVVKVVQRKNAKAQLKVTTIRWQYRSQAAKFWFGIANNNNKLIKRKYTFNLGNDWFVLSTTQAKALQKQIKQKQSQMQAAAKTYVAQQVKARLTAAMAKDPTMSTSQQQALSQQFAKQATAAYQQQAVAQAVKEVKQQTK
ncbi:MAG: DUF4811 domain-containing protein [Liquorilactobacillus ghanensis]|uniref:DUF4811 domain-containing protein n=1 Tax=Liquorilactobacillus ghanensis TaxID=399370 RepID=UPI0039EA73E8